MRKMLLVSALVVSCFTCSAFGAWTNYWQYNANDADNKIQDAIDSISANGGLLASKLVAGGTAPAINGAAITNLAGGNIASGNIGVARISTALSTATGGAVGISTNFGLWGMTAGTPTDAVNTNLTAPISIPVRFNGTNYYIRGYLTTGP